MDKYALIVLERIIIKFDMRIELSRHRGYPYMAKGALLTYMEGYEPALSDLRKILKWGRTRSYVTREEWNQIIIMFQRLEKTDEHEITKPGIVAGKTAPWQEWATTLIPAGGNKW
jgi:hypothetical protein